MKTRKPVDISWGGRKRERFTGIQRKLWRVSMVCNVWWEESPGKCSCRLEMALLSFLILYQVSTLVICFSFLQKTLVICFCLCFGTMNIENNRVRRVCLCMSMMSHHSCYRLLDMSICLASTIFGWSPKSDLSCLFVKNN